VLVAILILLVGVLGVVSLIDGANFATAKTKSREGGVNLAREILDGARAVDYDKLNTAEVVGELQSQPGLGDSEPADGWQIARRGITYTVSEVPVCKVDDASDGLGDHADGGFCANPSPTVPPDGNPDDLRRMDVRIEWSVGALKSSNRQTTLIINPSGSLGPSVKTFCVTGLPAIPPITTCPGTPIDVVSHASKKKVSFGATTSSAASFRWQVDDANSNGYATSTPSGSSTSWTFDWDLGTVGTFSCPSAPTWTLDGNYLVAGQGFDSNGIQGQRKTLTLTVNRSLPFETCGLDGGYNHPPDKSPVLDLQWRANPERDIVGYSVYRVGDVSQVPEEVCPLTTETSCFRENPAPGTYYVVAVDRDATTGDLREGLGGTTLTIDPPSGIQPPSSPPKVYGARSEGLPAISWDAASDPDGISFYRIYRDGTAYADRYDKTGNGVILSWIDSNPGTDRHTYYVSAVDTNFEESAPTGPVQP
jgi:hypothetical protein